MTDGQDNFRRELHALQQRLERIERALGLDEASPPSPIESPPTAPPVTPPPTVEHKPAPPPPPAPLAPPPIQPPKTVEPEILPQSAETYAVESPPVTAPSLPPSADTSGAASPVQSAAPPESAAPKVGLELVIAAKWFAWIGAIIIVLGAAFALREFGTDLWTRLSPSAKCLVVAAFGGALLCAGEITLRRIGRLAAVGLFSAGLGVLYLDAFATFQFFDPPLVSREWSFALMAVVALIGFGVTLRTSFRTIGILSLIGGYATPILLSSGGGHEVELLSFVTVLLGIALALSAAAPRPYRTLRYVALGLHLFVAGGWIIAEGSAHWLLAMVFMSIWWVMVLAEATLAAVRRQSALGNPTAVLLATACYVTAGTFILHGAVPAGVDWLGLYTAGIGVLSAATALQFGPGLDGLRQRPKFAIDKLAIALWAQAGVLLIVAAALQFDGYGRSVAWLAMAAAAIELGNRLRSRGLDVFGLIVGSLAIVMVATIDALFSPILGTDILTFNAGRFTGTIDRWSLLCLGAIIATHYAAHRLRASIEDGWRPMPAIVATVGTAYWMGLCIARTDGLATSCALLFGCVALFLVDRLNRNVRTHEIGIGLLLITAGWWVVVDVLSYRGPWTGSWPGTDTLPIANAQFAVALVIAGLLVVAYIIRLRVQTVRATSAGDDAIGTQQVIHLTPLLAVVAALVLLIGGSAEIERFVSIVERSMQSEPNWPVVLWRVFWITMFVALSAAVMMLIGLRRRLRPMLTTGTAMVWGCALLWLSYGTLIQLVDEGLADVMPVLNEQFGAGLACTAAMVAAWLTLRASMRRTSPDTEPGQQRSDQLSAAASMALIGVLCLWLGSFEIARVFHPDRMAVQMGLSLYWGIFAVTLIVIGFRWRMPAARYVGLALLGITAAKVLTIDLATVEKIWRIVSLMVTGLLAVGVSVGYARLAPKLESTKHNDRPQV